MRLLLPPFERAAGDGVGRVKLPGGVDPSTWTPHRADMSAEVLPAPRAGRFGVGEAPRWGVNKAGGTPGVRGARNLVGLVRGLDRGTQNGGGLETATFTGAPAARVHAQAHQTPPKAGQHTWRGRSVVAERSGRRWAVETTLREWWFGVWAWTGTCQR